MKFRTIFLVAILALLVVLALPVAAQTPTTATVGYNGFSFSYDTTLATHIDIDSFAGDPVALEQPGGPEVKHMQFALSSADTTPSIFDAPMAIRLYNTADFSGYENQTGAWQTLQGLLDTRPDLTPYMSVGTSTDNALPFLPIMPASQVLRARVQYVETAAVRGISYITVYRQDVSPLLGNEFFYTFQGLSSDGMYYVSAIVKLNTGLFPAEIPADFNMETFQTGFNDYIGQSIGTLNAAQAADFTPSLTTADALVQSFSFTASAPAQPPAATAPASSDASLGGLGGVNWVLMSIGPNAAPTNPPITLTFAPDGIGGSAGCNTYFGQFQYDVSALTFSDIGSTLIACEEPVMTQEQAYLNALQTVTAYQVTNGQLMLTYPEGVLVFNAEGAQATPTVEVPVANTDPSLGGLGGVQWVLVSYGPAGTPATALPEAPVTLDFTQQGVSGSAGCNQYSGTFVYNNNTLTFNPLVTTQMACADAAVNAQEQAYLAALQAATLYSIDAGTLQIVYPDGILIFKSA